MLHRPIFFRSKLDYISLPTTSRSFSPSRHRTNKKPRCISGRRLRYLPALVVLSLLFWCLKPQLPPLYQEYRNREDNLPHYSPDAPYPNGRHAKYIFYANHQRGVGWGNVMQELLLNALLAYTTKRSFVFYNYEWGTKSRYSLYNGRLIPSNIPLSAIVSGPLVGGPIDAPDAPRAVSEHHFLDVCRNRTIVRSEEVRDYRQKATGLQILNLWAQKLEAMEDRCIEVPRGSWGIFDYLLFGSKDVLDIWPVLSQSPIITQFDWSPLVYSGFESNRALFGSPVLNISATEGNMLASERFRIPGLLVLHIRRGDFAVHCDKLASWSTTFNGFNQFDDLPDRFDGPIGKDLSIYREHCYPSTHEIVSKVSQVKQQIPGLNRIYIMTNGKRKWIDELVQALQTAEKWEAVSSSRDLRLNWDQKFVTHGLDMLVAQRAQSFVGNGVGWQARAKHHVLLVGSSNGLRSWVIEEDIFILVATSNPYLFSVNVTHVGRIFPVILLSLVMHKFVLGHWPPESPTD